MGERTCAFHDFYIFYLLGSFKSSLHLTQRDALKNEHNSDIFGKMSQSLFNIPSSYTVYIVKLPETAEQSSSTQIKPQSKWFQSLNIHSSIKLFTEMFVLAVEIFAYL